MSRILVLRVRITYALAALARVRDFFLNVISIVALALKRSKKMMIEWKSLSLPPPTHGVGGNPACWVFRKFISFKKKRVRDGPRLAARQPHFVGPVAVV